jgi:hypothetical protein
MVCKTSAVYSDVTYLYNCINCCNTAMTSVMCPAQKDKVDDSRFYEDTRQTSRVVLLPCAVVRSL